MGKSARILGWEEFGLTAQKMNALLKEHGYLYGEPGAYGLTEKGAQYGQQQYHENGYGGYAYRGWETTTWDDSVVDALKADMATAELAADEPTSPVSQEPEPTPQFEDEFENSGYEGVYDTDDDGLPYIDTKTALIAGGVILGGFLTVRYGPTLWNNKIKPAAKKLKAKLTKKEVVELEENASVESQE